MHVQVVNLAAGLAIMTGACDQLRLRTHALLHLRSAAACTSLSNADRAQKVTGSIRVTLSGCVTLYSLDGALSPDNDEDLEG